MNNKASKKSQRKSHAPTLALSLFYIKLSINYKSILFCYNQLMKKVYAEIGFGNTTFLSTEFEDGDKEYRVPKFVFPTKIKSFYFRFWIFKKVFILSTNNGLVTQDKEKNKLKILFGISGEAN